MDICQSRRRHVTEKGAGYTLFGDHRKKLYLRRREFIQAAAVTAVGAAAGVLGVRGRAAPSWPRVKVPTFSKTSYGADEKPNAYQDITTYNNYYEFGTEKEDPSNNAGTLKTKPWTSRWTGWSPSPPITISKISSSRTRSKSAFIGCGASSAGRWSFRGSAFRWPVS